MPAWQKRQPSVQPRATSTATRSKTASAYGTGESSGNGKRLMSATQTRADPRRHARIERRAHDDEAGLGVDLGRVQLGHVEREALGQPAQPLAPRDAGTAERIAAHASTSAGSSLLGLADEERVDERRHRLGVRRGRARRTRTSGASSRAIGGAQRRCRPDRAG